MDANGADDALSFFDGEPLLRIIASALTRLSLQTTPSHPVYDDTVQTAFNHLVLLCLRRGVAPPASVPEMASWAATIPLREWPLGLPEELDAASGYLVDADTRTPLQQCLEWVIPAPDPVAEQFENELMGEAISQCRAAVAPESYTAFRRLLIKHPVLTGSELAMLGEDLDLVLLDQAIRRVYQPAPPAWQREGLYAACGRCGCLLIPARGRYQCELDRCRRDPGHGTVQTLDPQRAGGVYQLSRPLRMFITGPGLAETDLEAELAGLRLDVQMWPNFDAYDLRVTLPGGEVWAVDVKDRANPALLGRGTRPLPPDPPYDRGFLVVPAYRLREREAYKRIFAGHLPDDATGRLELLTDEEFVRRVKARTRRWPARPAPVTATPEAGLHA